MACVECSPQLPHKRSQKTGIVIFLIFLVLFLVNSSFAQDRININTASTEELLRIPGVGPALAARIIEYRHKHGGFKRPQEIIIVRGMSAKHYRQISHLI